MKINFEFKFIEYMANIILFIEYYKTKLFKDLLNRNVDKIPYIYRNKNESSKS